MITAIISYFAFPAFLNINEEEEDIECIETGELTADKINYFFLLSHKEAFMAFFACWLAYSSSSYNDSTWSMELYNVYNATND